MSLSCRKKRREQQYWNDLTILSGGPPGKSMGDKIGYSLAFFLNGISYNEKEAHIKAEQLRKTLEKSFNDSETNNPKMASIDLSKFNFKRDYD